MELRLLELSELLPRVIFLEQDYFNALERINHNDVIFIQDHRNNSSWIASLNAFIGNAALDERLSVIMISQLIQLEVTSVYCELICSYQRVLIHTINPDDVKFI